MLKIATATTLLIACLCAPIAWADETKPSVGDVSGFGGETLPSEPTNTQTEQVGMPGNEPLAEPGATQRTGTQGAGSRNLPNLPPVTTASIALKNQGLKELQPARYAILSDPTANTEGLDPARYAVLSNPPAEQKISAPPLSKLTGPANPVLNTVRASEGF